MLERAPLDSKFLLIPNYPPMNLLLTMGLFVISARLWSGICSLAEIGTTCFLVGVLAGSFAILYALDSCGFCFARGDIFCFRGGVVSLSEDWCEFL